MIDEKLRGGDLERNLGVKGLGFNFSFGGSLSAAPSYLMQRNQLYTPSTCTYSTLFLHILREVTVNSPEGMKTIKIGLWKLAFHSCS